MGVPVFCGFPRVDRSLGFLHRADLGCHGRQRLAQRRRATPSRACGVAPLLDIAEASQRVRLGTKSGIDK